MSVIGKAVSDAPRERLREWITVGLPVARERLHARLTISATLAWELARITTLVLVGVVLHAWNLFGSPRYQGDEGVYMASAWSLLHGDITPYTYNYGHPPLGWALIALWCQLTGGFFTFGTAINTGRVFMVVIYAVSAVFVYLIAQRLTGHWQAAAIATALFSYSPLAINFQRQVLLDNIGTMWILIAFYLFVVSESRLRYLVASAAIFGIATLTKETMIVFFPAFAIGVWRGMTPFQRRYALLVFSYVGLGIVSIFVLVAALKNELFPSGTLLGGSAPHVSMIQTFQSQVSRGGIQGSFLGQWETWTRDDILMTVAGLLCTAGNLYLYRKKPVAHVAALLSAIYFLFLARGGVTFAYYIIAVLPLFALNIALMADIAVSRLIQLTEGDQVSLPGSFSPDAIRLATVMVLLMIGVYAAPLNRTNLTANGVAPEIAAMQWMSLHAPRSSMVVASHYFWLDMRAPGGMGATYGAPFQNVQMYWNVATDRAVLDGVLQNNWNNIDYVIEDSDMAVDRANYGMTIINDAIAHADVAASFQNSRFWVTIYQVRHTGAAAAEAASRADIITRVTGGGASGAASQSPAALTMPPTSVTSVSLSGAPAKVRVTANELNLRSGPSLSASVLSLLAYGTILRKLSTHAGWIYVTSAHAHGWVASQWTAPV